MKSPPPPGGGGGGPTLLGGRWAVGGEGRLSHRHRHRQSAAGRARTVRPASAELQCGQSGDRSIQGLQRCRRELGEVDFSEWGVGSSASDSELEPALY